MPPVCAPLQPPLGAFSELRSASSLQLIQTISVVDRDEPQSGHHFYFTLAPEAASSSRHFSLLDFQGESLT